MLFVDAFTKFNSAWMETNQEALVLYGTAGRRFFATSPGAEAWMARRTLFTFTGDFDVTVEGEIDVHDLVPGSAGWLESIMVKEQANEANYVYIARLVNTSTGYYEGKSAADAAATVSTAAKAFRLRLTRAGSMVKAYYWNNSQWEWNGNPAGLGFTQALTGDLFVQLQERPRVGLASIVTTTNFSLTAATLKGRLFNGWSNLQRLTIDSAMISGAGTLAGFPVQLTERNVSSDFWSAVASDGRDIRVTSDMLGDMEVPVHVAFIDKANKRLLVRCKLDLDGANGTTFYLWSGNAAASMPAADSAYGSRNVYDSSTRMAVCMVQDYVPGATVLADSFTGADGAAPDSATWPTQSNVTGKMAINGNRLRYASSGEPGTTYTSIKSATQSITGDFEVTLDFSDAAAVGDWTFPVQLSLRSPDNTRYVYAGVYFDDVDYYAVRGEGGGAMFAPRSVTQGRLRLLRRGADFYAFYWNADLAQWEWNGDPDGVKLVTALSGDVQIRIQCDQFGGAGNHTACALDNLVCRQLTLQQADATANGCDVTVPAGGGAVFPEHATVAKGWRFDAASSACALIANASNLNTSFVTVTLYGRLRSLSGRQDIVSRQNSGNASTVVIRYDSALYWWGAVRLEGSETTARNVYSNSAGGLGDSVVTLRYDGSTVNLFVNGVKQTSAVSQAGVIDTDSPGEMAMGRHPSLTNYYSGDIFSVTYSGVGRSDDWVLTEHNNMMYPDRFVTVAGATPYTDLKGATVEAGIATADALGYPTQSKTAHDGKYFWVFYVKTANNFQCAFADGENAGNLSFPASSQKAMGAVTAGAHFDAAYSPRQAWANLFYSKPGEAWDMLVQYNKQDAHLAENTLNFQFSGVNGAVQVTNGFPTCCASEFNGYGYVAGFENGVSKRIRMTHVAKIYADGYTGSDSYTVADFGAGNTMSGAPQLVPFIPDGGVVLYSKRDTAMTGAELYSKNFAGLNAAPDTAASVVLNGSGLDALYKETNYRALPAANGKLLVLFKSDADGGLSLYYKVRTATGVYGKRRLLTSMGVAGDGGFTATAAVGNNAVYVFVVHAGTIQLFVWDAVTECVTGPFQLVSGITFKSYNISACLKAYWRMVVAYHDSSNSLKAITLKLPEMARVSSADGNSVWVSSTMNTEARAVSYGGTTLLYWTDIDGRGYANVFDGNAMKWASPQPFSTYRYWDLHNYIYACVDALGYVWQLEGGRGASGSTNNLKVKKSGYPLNHASFDFTNWMDISPAGLNGRGYKAIVVDQAGVPYLLWIKVGLWYDDAHEIQLFTYNREAGTWGVPVTLCHCPWGPYFSDLQTGPILGAEASGQKSIHLTWSQRGDYGGGPFYSSGSIPQMFVSYFRLLPQAVTRCAGTATGGGQATLVDATANFTAAGVTAGDVLYNLANGRSGRILVVTPTQLTTSDMVAPNEAGQGYRVGQLGTFKAYRADGVEMPLPLDGQDGDNMDNLFRSSHVFGYPERSVANNAASFEVGGHMHIHGHWYRCTTAGTSGASLAVFPAAPGHYQTINDGTVVWTEQGYYLDETARSVSNPVRLEYSSGAPVVQCVMDDDTTLEYKGGRLFVWDGTKWRTSLITGFVPAPNTIAVNNRDKYLLATQVAGNQLDLMVSEDKGASWSTLRTIVNGNASWAGAPLMFNHSWSVKIVTYYQYSWLFKLEGYISYARINEFSAVLRLRLDRY